MGLTVDYIPALIVAKNSKGEFVMISNVDKNETYYCPVCGGEVKPRALDSIYTQSHYYHVNKSTCNNESILHWMYKNWLFEAGTLFRIDGVEYEIEFFEVEKEFNTKFGVYRPDIYVKTKNGEEILFEINYSNKKDKSFSDKWIDIGINVVEVDVKNLLQSNIVNSIPEFKYIFKDGKYSGVNNKYEKRDLYYSFRNLIEDEETAAKKVEQYNWLWNDIKNNNDDDIKTSLTEINYDDSVFCTKVLKKLKCHDKYEFCKDVVTIRMNEIIRSKIDSDVILKTKQQSSQYYCFYLIKPFKYGDIVNSFSVRSYDGLFYEEDFESDLKYCFDKLIEILNNIKSKTEEIEKHIKDAGYDFVISIINGRNMNLKVTMYSEIMKKDIILFNRTYYYWETVNVDYVMNTCENRKEYLEAEYISNIEYSKNVKKLYSDIDELSKEIVKIDENFKIEIDKKQKLVLIKHCDSVVYRCRYDKNKNGSISKELTKENILDVVIKINDGFKKQFELLEQINKCKNKLWKIKISEIDETLISYDITFNLAGFTYTTKYGCISNIDECIKIITETMNSLINRKYKYVRVFR